MPPFRAFTIREEFSVSEVVDRAVADHPLAEDMFESAKWRIAREPDCGTPVTDVSQPRLLVHILPNLDGHTPGMLVRYHVADAHTIDIDWVHFYPYDEAIAIRPGAYVR